MQISSEKLKFLTVEAIKNMHYVFIRENIAKIKIAIAKMKISLIIKHH